MWCISSTSTAAAPWAIGTMRRMFSLLGAVASSRNNQVSTPPTSSCLTGDSAMTSFGRWRLQTISPDCASSTKSFAFVLPISTTAIRQASIDSILYRGHVIVRQPLPYTESAYKPYGAGPAAVIPSSKRIVLISCNTLARPKIHLLPRRPTLNRTFHVYLDRTFLMLLTCVRSLSCAYDRGVIQCFAPPWTTCEAALSEAFHLLGARGTPGLSALLRRRSLLVAFKLAKD